MAAINSRLLARRWRKKGKRDASSEIANLTRAVLEREKSRIEKGRRV